jgi:hypothetical protein
MRVGSFVQCPIAPYLNLPPGPRYRSKRPIIQMEALGPSSQNVSGNNHNAHQIPWYHTLVAALTWIPPPPNMAAEPAERVLILIFALLK